MNNTAPFRGEIYLHWNTVSNKGYVGQTVTGMKKRWDGHLRSSRCAKTPAYHKLFSRSIRKYGSEVFEHQLLSIAKSQKDLDNLEKVWIILLQTKAPNGYNLTDGGDSGTFGHVVSPETRAVLSAATKEQWKDPEFRAKYSELRKNKPGGRNWKPTKEHIAAVVSAHVGKKQSEETIAKRISKTTGMKRTEESRLKMRNSHLGHKASEETKARMAEAQRRRYL